MHKRALRGSKAVNQFETPLSPFTAIVINSIKKDKVEPTKLKSKLVVPFNARHCAPLKSITAAAVAVQASRLQSLCFFFQLKSMTADAVACLQHASVTQLIYLSGIPWPGIVNQSIHLLAIHMHPPMSSRGRRSMINGAT